MSDYAKKQLEQLAARIAKLEASDKAPAALRLRDRLARAAQRWGRVRS